MSEPGEKPKVQLRRLLSLARPELPRLTVATIALLITSGTTLIYPQAIRFMVDGLTGEDTPFSLNTGAVVLVVLFLVQSAFTMLRTWLFTASGSRRSAHQRQ